jgi:hypothetical protein
MHSSFKIDGGIAIVAGHLHLDLHNCFDFAGFEYRPSERIARLVWVKSRREEISKSLPHKLTLSFDGVINLAVQRRDDGMPFTEDSCISDIAFLPPELGDRYDCHFPGHRSNDEHLSMVFQSRSGIKIWAANVIHQMEPA